MKKPRKAQLDPWGNRQMKSELTDAEQAWMLELNRVGTEEGMQGFPFDTARLYRNCWLEDFKAGLTPREAIERNKPHEQAVQDPNLTDVFKCRSCGALTERCINR